MTVIPVVLSGGSGSRLWPLSRSAFPKQFLPLVSDKTMIQETLRRLDGIEMAEPVVVCSEKHKATVKNQLEEIGIKNPVIILEPVARNTAPAIAAACIEAEKKDKDAVVIVLPSDHNIKNIDVFQKVVKNSIEIAQKGNLVTFGITPTFAATGYGYIEAENGENGLGIYDIKRFVEKPDADTAQKYVESGKFFWNSGMFVFRAETYLDELKNLEKSIFDATSESVAKADEKDGFVKLDEDSFKKNPNISIDYAVMEKTRKGKVMPLAAQWSDVGSWSSLWDVSRKDTEGNVIKGETVTENVKNSFIYSKKRLVAAIGLENIVIVDTDDALLVADKSHSEDVKKIVEKLKSGGKSSLA